MKIYKLKQLWPGCHESWYVGMEFRMDSNGDSIIPNDNDVYVDSLNISVLEQYPDYFTPALPHIVDFNGDIIYHDDAVLMYNDRGCFHGFACFNHFIPAGKGEDWYSLDFAPAIDYPGLYVKNLLYGIPKSDDVIIVKRVAMPDQIDKYSFGLGDLTQDVVYVCFHVKGHEFLFSLSNKTPSGRFKGYPLTGFKKTYSIDIKWLQGCMFRMATKAEIEIYNRMNRPIVKTHDGVDIYESSLPIKLFRVYRNAPISEHHITDRPGLDFVLSDRYGPFKLFANKENAMEYRLLNTKCLSINDVATVYSTANKFPENNKSSQGNQLRKLVESILNKPN